MDQFWKNEYAFGYRRMLYLVTPNETTFRTLQDAPNYVDKAHFWIFMFIVVEQLFSFLAHKPYYNVTDSLTSIGGGLLQSAFRTFFRYAEFSAYCWLYNNYRLFDLPWDSVWLWILAFLFVDLGYYWFHRAVHEINFLWTFHQMHHSSEYYNFTTALRQGMVQQYVAMFFYLPGALFVPPPAHLVHLTLSLLYQFSMHTQFVPKLGLVGLIFNTPSHHRVHHGRNAYCIDKNYGGTLIIWDRLFGTFQDEKPDEKVAYGLVHSVGTYDQMYCQLFYFKYVFCDKILSVTSVWDKLKSLVYGPGWHPGTSRNGDIAEIPVACDHAPRYDVNSNIWLQAYITVQLGICVLFYQQMTALSKTSGHMDLLPYLAFLVLSVFNFGWLFEKRPYAYQLELLRHVVTYFCMTHGFIRLDDSKPYVVNSALLPCFSALLFYFFYVRPKKQEA